jgi:hypothetical protein
MRLHRKNLVKQEIRFLPERRAGNGRLQGRRAGVSAYRRLGVGSLPGPFAPPEPSDQMGPMGLMGLMRPPISPIRSKRPSVF